MTLRNAFENLAVESKQDAANVILSAIQLATESGSTEAKQDVANTLLTAIKLATESGSTAAKQDALKTVLDAVLLAVDGLEGKDFATQATAAAILAELDQKLEQGQWIEARQALHDSFNANANIQVGNLDVGPANPVPITGTVVSSGAELTVVNAIDQQNFDLDAAAFNFTTAIGGAYLLSRIELNFSTTAVRDITITSAQGTELLKLTGDTSRNITIDGEDDAFESGDQITVQITSTAGPCLADVLVVISKGQLPLSSDPSIGAFSPTYSTGTVTGTGVVIGPVEQGSQGFMSVHLRGTFVAVLVIEGTNDPAGAANWVTLGVETASGLRTTSMKNPGVFFSPSVTRWTRVRCSAYTSGTATVDLMVSPQSRPSFAKDIRDKDGITSWAFTPFGTGKVAQPLWQAGSSFDGTALNYEEWDDQHINGGTGVVGGGQIRLRTGAADARARVSTRKSVEFLGDNENESFFVLRNGDTGTPDNVKRWGVYDDQDGFFIEQFHDGTSGKLRAVTRKSGVDTVDALFPIGVTTPANNTSYNFWRFIYTPSFILVYQGTNLVHLFIAGTTSLEPMFANFTLPARMENININGSTADTSMYAQSVSVSRLAAEDSREVIISRNVRTRTPLGAGATWTSGWEDMQQFPCFAIALRGNPRGATGTLRFWFTENPEDANALIGPIELDVDDLNISVPIPVINVGPFVKVEYENHLTPQTEFRLHAIQYRQYPGDLTRFPLQVIGPNEPLKVVRSLVEPSPVGERGFLGADREIFGAGIVGTRISRITLNPTRPLTNNDVTTTVSGGATVTQEPTFAEFRLQTGTATTASARMETNQKVRYRPGRELYAMYPMRFTPGVAGSHQRGGLYDDQDGFFLGYQGTVFGFTVRKGGVDTFTPLSGANGDPLDGTAQSRFSRGARLEALTTGNKNVWKLRVGLLGSSLQYFDVQSPDGLWMRVHSNRFPNLQSDASILNWTLPFRTEVIKTAAGATNLVVGLGSVDAGFVGDSGGLEPSTTDGRQHVTASFAGEVASGIKYTPPAGRRFIIKSITMSAINSSIAGAAQIRLRDGSAVGTLLMPIVIEEATGSVDKTFVVSQSYPEGLRVDTGVYLEIVGGLTVSVDATIAGYSEAL